MAGVAFGLSARYGASFFSVDRPSQPIAPGRVRPTGGLYLSVLVIRSKRRLLGSCGIHSIPKTSPKSLACSSMHGPRLPFPYPRTPASPAEHISVQSASISPLPACTGSTFVSKKWHLLPIYMIDLTPLVVVRDFPGCFLKLRAPFRCRACVLELVSRLNPSI